MKKSMKIIAMILILAILNTEFCFAATAFSLDEALFYGQAKSFFKGDLRKSTIAISEKQKSISGASSGGKLSMSLDFMKIFEDGPPYQKLFGNVTKGPTAVYNYNVEVKKQPFTVSKTEYAITQAYFSVYKAKLEEERAFSRYKEADEKLNKGNILYSKGEISEEGLNDQKKKVEASKKRHEAAKNDFINKISKLNNSVYLKNNIKYKDYKDLKKFVSKYNIGQDINSLFGSDNSIGFKNLSNNYIYDMSLKRARVGSNELAGLINAAINNNWEIVAMNEQLKIDEYYIYACLDLYKKEFGKGEVYNLEQMIKSGLYTIDDLDFTLKYDRFISYLIGRYGENWSPYFEISLLFFSIKIPKLFKYDQYDGVRYLEDSRYELQKRVMQFLQLLMDIENQRKIIAELTSTLFVEINKLDRDYEDLKSNFENLKAEYDINQVKYNNKKIKADILISQKDELDETDDKIHSTLMDMNEKILELGYLTGGMYDRYTAAFDSPTPKTDSSPFLAPETDDVLEEIDKLNETSYTVNYTIDTAAKNDVSISTADLSLSVSGVGFDCNQYEILTSDGIEVSGVLNISEKFRHFETVFSNLQDLKIKFYKDGVQMALGEFDGYGVIGKVKIKQ